MTGDYPDFSRVNGRVRSIFVHFIVVNSLTEENALLFC